MLATSPKAIEESCDQLLAGGDASPCELIPAGDVEDPAWRYYLLNPYGSPPSILMAAHGAPINERLPRLLINYSGSRIIAPKLYLDVVETAARASDEPAANRREMLLFSRRHRAKWRDKIWLPGARLDAGREDYDN